MTTTVAINDKTHLLLIRKQTQLLEKGIRMKLSDILEQCVEKSIENINMEENKL